MPAQGRWVTLLGYRAWYSEAEEELMRGFVKSYEAGTITREEFDAQVRFVHGAMAVLDARLVDELPPAAPVPKPQARKVG